MCVIYQRLGDAISSDPSLGGAFTSSGRRRRRWGGEIERKKMEECALCSKPARMYCESDRARLCWDCDEKVHGANFLVARHVRCLLCRTCQTPTPWKASGTRLGRTVSLCEECAGEGCGEAERGEVERRRAGDDLAEVEEEEEMELETDSEREDDDVEEGEEEDEDDENQVVPWSNAGDDKIQPPPLSSSSSSDESSSSGKRKRGGADGEASQVGTTTEGTSSSHVETSSRCAAAAEVRHRWGSRRSLYAGIGQSGSGSF